MGVVLGLVDFVLAIDFACYYACACGFVVVGFLLVACS